MAGTAADELMLLERVFLRLGSAETDDQLQNVLGKFLPPVLLKLASTQEGVRKKVMELLIHVNKRVKTRPLVQLPVEALLAQYSDPAATSFVTNFTIIYIKTGFPRLPVEKQAELVPIILNSLADKPQSHVDSLLLLIVPLLGKVKVPTDPTKAGDIFGLSEKVALSKHLRGILLDMLLLPYNALSPQSNDDLPNVTLPVPPSMSEKSFKRITVNNPMKPEELEEIKLGVVKFLSHEVFKNEEILPHLIVAAADTRFSIANLADNELKKIVGSIDWSNLTTCLPLYILFLGTQTSSEAADVKKSPACTRIRLKLLTYLCRCTGKALPFPFCIHLVFESLYGTNTNARLKTLALQFTISIIRYADETPLKLSASLLLTGLQKLTLEGDESHQGQAYIIIGMLAQKFPLIVYHKIELLEKYFQNLESSSPELKLNIREGLISLISAYNFSVFPEDVNKDGRLDLIFALIKSKIMAEEAMVRYGVVKTLANVFPPDHVPSKVLLLQATGDMKEEVSSEALKSLYGTARKSDINLSKENTENAKITLPSFTEIIKYVFEESEINSRDTGKKITFGNHVLPFQVPTYVEVLIYLRLCLVQNLDVPLTREILKHPCEYTPIIRDFLQDLHKKSDNTNSPLERYVTLIKTLLLANISPEPIGCMIECTGSVPELSKILQPNLNWVRDQLGHAKEEIRENMATLYAILVNHVTDAEFSKALAYLISQTSSGKTIEFQHGAVLALGTVIEYAKFNNSRNLNVVLEEIVFTLDGFLKHQNVGLVSAACTSIGLIGSSTPLPLKTNEEPTDTGSPAAKRPANETLSKLDLTNHLLDILKNTKHPAKTRERAARSLGLLCVGEIFPHTKDILQGLLGTAKETKDVEVHFTIGEALVMCCQNVQSPEARNKWIFSAETFVPPKNGGEEGKKWLDWLLDELLTMVKQPHPNARQACSIWLLALLKGCVNNEAILQRLPLLQSAFMDLLCENNDIVQDVASKALCVMFDTYKCKDLLGNLVKQLTQGTTKVAQVTSDTKLFEEGQLGTAPSGGNLTTYKELCSLASDLNKPDMIYQFLHLANHNAIWNSKKGAAFGFSSIAEKCRADLKTYLPQIVPKLYRYQYDPTPSIQNSMQNIWRVLVPEQSKAIDEFYFEILGDLLENLNSHQYRVRQSCCLALQDLLKGSANRSIHDCVGHMDELWGKLFRVMDDHHEATRNAANSTARVLSKLCIRGCDKSQGKSGVKMVEAILPPLLNIGITNSVADIRLVSLQTISELVGSAGQQLKPFLAKLIPALLQATGELESAKLSYLSTMLGAQSQMQETVDSARANFAKSHFTTETVSKSLQYADASILEELVPKVVELMKGSVGLGTRVACAHFVTLLVVQMGKDLQPYTGKFLAALVNGLTDRNAAIRKHYAVTIGQLVGTAKDSSLEKLFAKLKHWYFEREDDTIRSACAFTIQSIGIHNQEILKNYSQEVLPLVFFAMHAEKSIETEKTLEVWNEIWSEHSPGTETGIRQNLENICDILKTALESPSWTMKAQSANAVAAIASKLGTTMDSKHRNSLISILLNGLSGRTWNGKDKLLKALASICSNCKDSIKEDKTLKISDIVEAVLKESKKEEIVYKNEALKSLSEIISALEVDKFDEIYAIIEPILKKEKNKEEDEDMTSEEMSKKRENVIKIQETAYETLGKTWPPNSRETQEKYREMFVEHCVNCLPLITRTIQVSVISALYSFVDKLIILKETNLTQKDALILQKINENIVRALQYSLGISKYTKLRKESLNVIFCLANNLKESKNVQEFEKLKKMFSEISDELAKDNQPEIKSRVTDIRKIFSNNV